MKHFLLAATAMGALAPAAAHADGAAIGELVVTGRPSALALDRAAPAASRLGLSGREVPATLDIISQQRMQTEGLRTSVEAFNAAPGVNGGTLPGSVGVTSMRGFTSTAIAYLYDGVRVTGSNSSIRNFDTFNFDRVEVLKGPASVLYGEGALAGAINLVPKRPQLGEMSGDALLSLGSFDTLRAGLGGNLALGDAAALRADASFSRSSGWADDTGSLTRAVTVALRVEPTDRLALTLSGDYSHDDYATAYFGSTLVPAAFARAPSGMVRNNQHLVLDKATIRRNYNVEDGEMNSTAWQLRARADYRLSDRWKLSNELAWYTADRLWKNSEDVAFDAATGLLNRSTTLIAHDHDYWVNRAVLAFDGPLGGHRNRFSLGAEYSDTHFITHRRFGTTTPVDRFAPVRGRFPDVTAANFPGAGNRVDWVSDASVAAVFAEEALNLTSKWLLVGGIRYDHVKLKRRTFDLNTGAADTFAQDYDPVSWRIGTVYDLAPKTQLYAQFSRAVTPVSAFLFLNAANARFDLSAGEALEAGIKTSFWNDRIDLTAAAYRIAQDDILTRDPNNPALIVQGGRQSSRGVEMSVSAALTDQLRIDAGAAMLESRFDTLIEAGGVDRTGNRPPNVPEQMFDLSAYYSLKTLPLTFGATIRHDGDFYTSNANTYRVAARTTFDAQVSWQAPFGRLTLRGRNLFDALYADWSGYGATQVYIGAPRSFDVTLARSF
ncbi:MAG TPA: TonB-dependent siderophore receptor [Phenylobacterium sp.]|nr:TonB-dependent siderophore receptor [Phenylobacterium sp.]